jgi:aspartate dehydrogenase
VEDHPLARVTAVDPLCAGQLEGATVLTDLHQIAQCNVDLVIEAAEKDVVEAVAADVLSQRDLLVFSVSSLADDALREQLRGICQAQGTRLFIPHGAILGLDGIADGRDIIETVSITTTKNPRNLGLTQPAEGVLYDGLTRGACKQFPRNVNVHASLAVVGLGFDQTHSVVVADPESSRMIHEIRVTGPGLNWDIKIVSQSIGDVTGSYTPVSAANTVRRILADTYDIVLA